MWGFLVFARLFVNGGNGFFGVTAGEGRWMLRGSELASRVRGVFLLVRINVCVNGASGT